MFCLLAFLVLRNMYYLCKEHLGKKKENDINRRTDGGIWREALV